MSVLGIKSEYSFLNSFLKLDEIIKYSNEKHYSFIAISDVGNVFCIYKLFKLAKENNIKPIIGCELNVRVSKEIISSFCFYPKNENGYLNLLTLLKINNFDKEEIKIEELKKYCKDIMVVSSGISSYVYKNFPSIDITNYDKKRDDINYLNYIDTLNIFKKKIPNFYIGMSYDTFEAKTYLNDVLYKIVKDINIPLLPFHTTCYINSNDNRDFNDFIKISNIKNNISETTDFSFWDIEKIKSEFTYKELFDNLDNFINSISFEFKIFSNEIFKIVENPKLKLYDECFKRLKELNLSDNKIYLERLDYELGVVDKMGFSNYFLIVWDLVNYAKKNDILVGFGRGSSAASLIAYLLNITEIDPIKYELYFERFLNISRWQMPDIDIDFPDDKREDVISYLKNKYGLSHIAFITTFDCFGKKSAIRDITKIKEYNKKTNKENPIYQNMNIELDSLNLSKKIEGLPRHIGTHPAGILFFKDEVDKIFPVRKNQLGYYQVDFEMSEIEEFKLLKTDLLALRNLKIMSDCIKLIKIRNPKFNIKEIPLDDIKTYDILNKLETDNIFQLESSGMRDVIYKLKPKCFTDIINLIAIYRPGPLKIINEFIQRKNGKKYEIIDNSIKDIIKPTYGFIIFQEQIMQIAKTYANYSMSEADILRRGISKKDEKILLENKNKFIKKAILNGKDEKTAAKIYSYILEFSDYGFNKAHSVSYATMTYKMAYLKANYFLEFAISILNNAIGDIKITLKYLNILEDLGYKIMPPIINKAKDKYYFSDNFIYLPIQIVKGISDDVAKSIIKKRSEKEFENLKDFIKRTKDNLSDSQVKSLIFASCFDDFLKNKKALINKLENNYFDELIEVKEEENKDYCFNDLVEYEMKSYGFNFFYNPISIIKKISKIMNVSYFSKDDIVKSGTYIARIDSYEVKKYNKNGITNKYLKVALTDDKVKLDAACFIDKLVSSKDIFINDNICKVNIVKSIYNGKDSYIIKNIEVINSTEKC